ncbi:hypothetical protein TI39_contig337g00018 [Zymoseptoria brevis]|uniref:Uncharacterized protein n=1 Tax=Zymoseptoria brevis TaxID=1047168 RepID=A0A0F4GS75_9PEZI|nr:hypothetical protein TI39_contig337g00018 [Zymoseptoria brevis]
MADQTAQALDSTIEAASAFENMRLEERDNNQTHKPDSTAVAMAIKKDCFCFADLPAEMPVDIYRYFTPQSLIVKHEYPEPVMRASICMPPIAQLDKRTRKEAVDVVHRKSRLCMRPRSGYVLPHIPRAIVRAMPIFAQSVTLLHVTVNLKTPELSPATIGCGSDRASEARFVFSMRGKDIRVEASMMDPQTEVARLELSVWMQAK